MSGIFRADRKRHSHWLVKLFLLSIRSRYSYFHPKRFEARQDFCQIPGVAEYSKSTAVLRSLY